MDRHAFVPAGLFALVLAFATPGLLDGQICATYPATPGALSLGGNIADVPGGTSFGVEANYNNRNPLGFFARFNLVRPDDDPDNLSIIGAGVSYEIAEFVPVIPSWLAICPVAGLSLSTRDGDSEFRVPLGLGFATEFALTQGFSVIPFAMPQFVLTRVSVNDVDVSDHNFGIGFGGLARIGNNLYAGVSAEKEFVEATDIDVSFRAGVTWPVR